jgi:hypothetical protein
MIRENKSTSKNRSKVTLTAPREEEEGILEAEGEAEDEGPPMVSFEPSFVHFMARVPIMELRVVQRQSKQSREWSKRNQKLCPKL